MAKRLIDQLAFKHPRMGHAQMHKKGWITKRGKNNESWKKRNKKKIKKESI